MNHSRRMSACLLEAARSGRAHWRRRRAPIRPDGAGSARSPSAPRTGSEADNPVPETQQCRARGCCICPCTATAYRACWIDSDGKKKKSSAACASNGRALFRVLTHAGRRGVGCRSRRAGKRQHGRAFLWPATARSRAVELSGGHGRIRGRRARPIIPALIGQSVPPPTVAAR
jgi:hypothetical protein